MPESVGCGLTIGYEKRRIALPRLLELTDASAETKG